MSVGWLLPEFIRERCGVNVKVHVRPWVIVPLLGPVLFGGKSVWEMGRNGIEWGRVGFFQKEWERVGLYWNDELFFWMEVRKSEIFL